MKIEQMNITQMNTYIIIHIYSMHIYWQRGEPLKEFAGEMRRLHSGLDRVQLERQRAEEQVLFNHICTHWNMSLYI